MPRSMLSVGDALIVVDVQLDFLPGGSLAVPKGDLILPVLKLYIAAFVKAGLRVVATRDWHPPDHCSFLQQGGPWPPHCVRGSVGASLAPMLELPVDALIVSKATERHRDAYSGFEGTDLDLRLHQAKVKRVFVGGLATDYCVLNTVRDALRLGFQTGLLLDAIKAVDLKPGDGDLAVAQMLRLGAMPIMSVQLVRPA
jgi:nicotinamidase/pyrazinamidase